MTPPTIRAMRPQFLPFGGGGGGVADGGVADGGVGGGGLVVGSSPVDAGESAGGGLVVASIGYHSRLGAGQGAGMEHATPTRSGWEALGPTPDAHLGYLGSRESNRRDQRGRH